jgi:DNA-binding NtrC family response regulator
MARILVVDDELNLREAIRLVLTANGHAVEVSETGENALEAYRIAPHDLLVLDISLPGMSGIETLQSIRAIAPAATAIFITAHSSIESAVEAMQAGGFDYLPKPFDNNELVLKVERALAHHRLGTRVHELEDQLEARSSFSGIVGKSDVIQQVVSRLSRVAGSDATVLLSGETGTGKELAARSVHRRSPRAHCPFVAVNCGAIPTTLAESELFGHERGAFTDARQERRGLFERGNRGTVFLDEVGELPLDLQVKLLRVLQEKEVVRLGGSRPIPVDVRIIAATHRTLSDEVAAGRFRDDLFWRLNVFQVHMPSLRDHLDDLPLLVEHLLEQVNAECRSEVEDVDAEALRHLRSHRWPGNVRELLSVLKHGAIMTEGKVIAATHLPPYLSGAHKATAASVCEATRTLKSALVAAERELIDAALRQHAGNREAAAAALGISRRALFYKLRDPRFAFPGAAGENESDPIFD